MEDAGQQSAGPAVGATTREAAAFAERLERYAGEARERAARTLAPRELHRAVRALSSLYVERRDKGRLAERAVEGAGKRAAFALFYSPLHFLTVRQIVEQLGAHRPAAPLIIDLGCGTGAAGAAWAISGGGAAVFGVDVNRWVLEELRFNLRCLGLRGRTKQINLAHYHLPSRCEAIILAYTLNEVLNPRVMRLGVRFQF